jgi:hypothetical protein
MARGICGTIDINGAYGLIAQIEGPDNRREIFWKSVRER